MVRSNKQKNRIAVLDFETDPFLYGREPKPFCAGIFDGEVYRYFWCDDAPERVAEYARDELQGYTIYAHNGGKFDFFFMLPFFDENLKIINGRIAKATIGKAVFTDSYLILPAPLSAHKKDDFDYSKMEKEKRQKYKHEILKYLKNDCLYLYDWVYKFRELFGNKLTIAGTSYAQLKETGYNAGTTSVFYDDIFRPFYFGGRVQNFENGLVDKPLQYVDINSAYPFAMLSAHPFGDKFVERLKIPDDENGGYFCDIEAISYGALPLRGDDFRLQYPSDNKVRNYKVTGWEVIAGLETGTLKIKKVNRVYYHRQKKNFSEFVNKFYNGRLEAKNNGDDTLAFFYKIILNSCYGKFGQDGRQFKDYSLTPSGCVPENFFSEDGEPVWTLNSEHETGHRIWEKPAPVERFNNVATAASITGFVRAYLWRHISAAKNPVYCDTDSIMCEKFNGEIGGGLGQWSVEANLKRGWYGGRKFYCVETDQAGDNKYKTACKGGRLTPEQIINEIENGGGFVWKKDSPSYSLKYGARFLERKISRQF